MAHPSFATYHRILFVTFLPRGGDVRGACKLQGADDAGGAQGAITRTSSISLASAGGAAESKEEEQQEEKKCV